MMAIDGDELLKRVQQEEIQAQVHGREFSTCFMSPGGSPSTEWWFVEDLIESAPTIEPERKKGKWIEYNATGKKQWMCSECCAEEKNPKVARFCYWCGADMRDDDIPIEYFESGGK